MYIRKLHIKNMKRLRDFTLDFTEADGSPRMWTVLIGENGTAKTTILQAIAMCAAGRLRVNELAGAHVPSLMPQQKSDGAMEISARFEFTEMGRKAWIHEGRSGDLPVDWHLVSRVNLDTRWTTLTGFDWYAQSNDYAKRQEKGVELTPLDKARAINKPFWFVAGYGVNRHFPYDNGATPDLFRASVERLRPLFNWQSSLTGIDFIDIFGARSRRGKQFVETLNRVLIKAGILPVEVTEISLKGRSARTPGDLPHRNTFTQQIGGRKVKLPISGVAHGMQSTLAWVSDLVGHILYEAESHLEPEVMEGCVLIDEIDLYLHPTWQVRLVDGLRKVFPHIQFIVTTHSPVMLSAFRPNEVIRLAVNEFSGKVEQVDTDPQYRSDPRALSGSELLQDFFGMRQGPFQPYGQELRELETLRNIPWRTPFQEKRLAQLEEELKDIAPPAPPSEPMEEEDSDVMDAEGGEE